MWYNAPWRILGETALLYTVDTDIGPGTQVAVDETYLYIGEKPYPLADYTEFKTERMLTSARLFAMDNNKNAIVFVTFSLACLPNIERLIKVIGNIKEGRQPLHDIKPETQLHCPACGQRYPEPQRRVCPRCMDKVGITKRLLLFFRGYTKQIIVILAFILAGTGLQLLSPIIGTKVLFDEVFANQGRFAGAIGTVVLLILLVRVLNQGLNALYMWVIAGIVPRIVYDIKLQIFEAMQRLSVGFYTSKRTAVLMRRISHDANNIYWFVVDGLPYLIVNGLMFLGVFAIMCVMNWQLSMVCLIITPLAVMLFRYMWVLFRRLHHRSWVYQSRLSAQVSDTVTARRVVKAYGREDEETQRFERLGAKQAALDLTAQNTGDTFFPLVSVLLFTGEVAITAIGGVMVLRGRLSLGTLLSFIVYFTMLYGPMQFMSRISRWWTRCVDSASRVFEVIDAIPDVAEPQNPIAPLDIKGHIVVDDVWFEYDPATPVIKGLSLEVPAGQTVGLVGKTGTGKSTLANLIARLYDVTSGSITIDGVNVKDWPRAKLRANIGIVSQDIYLFMGTIADNIRYASPDAPFEEVLAAAKAASAHDFIIKLPNGYETRVGAGGEDLSGGERQRLSIARTIIQNPKILILDEATAAMDTQTELAIQKSLYELGRGRTVISIAHRLSTLRDADFLCVLKKGKIVEQGTHVELLKQKGEYHKLYSIAQEGLKVINMGGA